MPEIFETELFKRSLAIGLRSDKRAERNKPGLSYVLNGKPVKDVGFSPVPNINQPIQFDSMPNWPFPQIFKGIKYTLLCTDTEIYLVDEVGWDTELLALYDVSAASNTTTVPVGGQWHFADHGDSWMLFNGECVIHKSRRNQVAGVLTQHGPVGEIPFLYKGVSVQTGCAFKGRYIIGGFGEGMGWSDDWKEQWQEWAENFPGRLGKDIPDLGKNYVLWSHIGGDLLWFLDSSVGVGGLLPYTAGGSDTGYNSDTPYIFNLFASNQIGWLPLPTQGYVRKLLPLKDEVIAYAEEGVFSLIHSPSPVPTFGWEKVSDSGIASRGSAGGGQSRHVYIDREGVLREVSSGSKSERFGYEEFFKPMIDDGNNIISSFDSNEEEHYIADGNKCYIKTSAGLGATSQIPSTLVNRFKELHMIGYTTGERGLRLVSDPFDFGLRGVKTLRVIELSGANFDNTYISVLWRIGNSGNFVQSEWIPVTPDGVASPVVSGTDFKVAVLVADDVDDFDLDNITCRAEVVDFRSIRGRYGD